MAEQTLTAILEACIARVWNERDPNARLAAIAEIYHTDARVYEPDQTVTGHPEISSVVDGLHGKMPAGFRFTMVGETLGHHGLVVARWHGGPPGEVIASGGDAARIVDGKIHEHWAYIDTPS